MLVVYVLSPLLVMIFGVMFGLPILFPVQPTRQLSSVSEDRALLMLKDDYANDRLSLEEFDAAVERALQGQSYQQASVEANMKTMGMLLSKGTTYIGDSCYSCSKPAPGGFCYNCEMARTLKPGFRGQMEINGKAFGPVRGF